MIEQQQQQTSSTRENRKYQKRKTPIQQDAWHLHLWQTGWTAPKQKNELKREEENWTELKGEEKLNGRRTELNWKGRRNWKGGELNWIERGGEIEREENWTELKGEEKLKGGGELNWIERRGEIGRGGELNWIERRGEIERGAELNWIERRGEIGRGGELNWIEGARTFELNSRHVLTNFTVILVVFSVFSYQLRSCCEFIVLQYSS